MKKTIGILTIDIEGAYSRMLWSHAARHTRQHGYDLLILPANSPNTPRDYLYQNNNLLNFINPDVMDVLICNPSLFENYLSRAETEELVSRIRDAVPLVSLNFQVDSAPSLLVDNGSGIRKAVQHLLEHHHFRRIGFVNGPEENDEAIERKNAYMQAMQAAGITPPDEWLFPGDFSFDRSRLTAIANADMLVRNFDALICANDYTAMGIIDGLREKSYSVPEDLAIIGFDNIQEAQHVFPALTTIKQPFREMARRSVDMAIGICEGRKQPAESWFETELIIRASCGCTDYLYNSIRRPTSGALSENPRDTRAYPDMKDHLLSYLPSPALDRIYPVFQSLMQQLLDCPADMEQHRLFLMNLEKLFDQEYFSHQSQPDWASLLSILIDSVYAYDREKARQWADLGLFDHARILVGKKQDLWQGSRELDFLRFYIYPLREIQRNMSGALNHSDITSVLAGSLDSLGIRTAYITLLEEGEQIKGLYSLLPRRSACIFARNNGVHEPDIQPDSPVGLETLQLIPPGLRPEADGVVRVVGPLYNRDTLYGFLVSDVPDFNISANESIRDLVSVALKSSFLNQERLKAENRLREILKDLEFNNRKLRRDSTIDELTGLLNRRGFFQDVDYLLHSRQKDAPLRYALLFCDMDGLKSINDTLGHAQGDQAIQDMSEILIDMFREDDSIARLGGDEFVVFAMDIPPDFESVVHEKLTRKLTSYNEKNRKPFSLSISIGIIEGMTDEQGIDIKMLMSLADERLYQNKQRKYRNSDSKQISVESE